MKKKITLTHLLFACIITWAIFGFLPFFICFQSSHIHKDYQDLNVAFVAASALFTGLAFAGTLWNIRHQRNKISEVLKETTLEVFTNVFAKTINDPIFIQAQDYICNGLFKEDLKLIPRNKNEALNIKDIQHIRNIRATKIADETERETQTLIDNPYKSVLYFCDKMEYMGIILKKEYIDSTILDFFGNTIIKSYNELKELLKASRKRNNSKSYYIHYRYLYCRALERKVPFEEDVDKLDKELTEIENKYYPIAKTAQG